MADQVIFLGEPSHERGGLFAIPPVAGEVLFAQASVRSVDAPVPLHETIDLLDPRVHSPVITHPSHHCSLHLLPNDENIA
ncbi:MAG: hypothetical protein DCF28_02340 [Alphaproteobacteria bacterium]|nr:MAG: hypothetical protein DCF28_02340 [Alphaproteobacteria bacterium]